MPFNDQLQECILAPCYTHYFVKPVSSQPQFTWIIARDHTPIDYFSLPDQYPTNEILPISLRKGDGGYQPGEMPENTLI